MNRIPSSDAVNGVAFTVADFLEAGRERLQLELVAGKGNVGMTIEEPVVNRPGLALTVSSRTSPGSECRCWVTRSSPTSSR